MSIFDTPTIEQLIAATEQRMAQLATEGNAEVGRLQKELEQSPKDPEMWFDLGIALNQTGVQYTELAQQLALLRYRLEHPDEEEEQAEEQPLSADISAVLPVFRQALEAFDHTQQLQADYYGVACQRGIAYANMQDPNNAKECFLQALEDDDEDFTAAYYLGQVYRDMGEDDLADRYLALSEQLNAADQ